MIRRVPFLGIVAVTALAFLATSVAAFFCSDALVQTLKGASSSSHSASTSRMALYAAKKAKKKVAVAKKETAAKKEEVSPLGFLTSKGILTNPFAAFSSDAPVQTLKGASSSPSASTQRTSLHAVKKAKKKAAAKKRAAAKKGKVANIKKADFTSAIAKKAGMSKADSGVVLKAKKKAAVKRKAAAKKATAKKATAKKATAKKGDVVNFRKADFVSAIAENTGMTKKDSGMVLAEVLSIIALEVAQGKRINIQGFGTFKLNYRQAKKGRNPATGEEIQIKASYSPSFSASKTFKELCN